MKRLKYNMTVIGCQMNVSDAERIEGILTDLGLEKWSCREEADVVIVTTCGVKQHAEDRIYGIIPRVKKRNPKAITILTGCLSKRADVQKRLNKHVDIWLNAPEMPRLAQLLMEKLPELKNSGSKNTSSLKNYLSLLPKYSNKYSAFVPIGNGCNNACTYCVVPKARGIEVYRNPSEIIKEVKSLVSKGYKEITLIAQNVDSYKHVNTNNEVTDFAELMKAVDKIEGEYWLRFSTNHPKDITGGLIEVLQNRKHICLHIHLPVQSGDNKILQAMNRKYTKEEYLRLVMFIKDCLDRYIPISLTTDIIVGYPGETEEQFNHTANLLNKVGFDMAYISQYSPRPGTASYHLKDNVSTEVKKRREQDLIAIVNKTCAENNNKYIGKEISVLVIKEKKGLLIGRTETSKNIKIKLKENAILKNLIGTFMEVRITKVDKLDLFGEIIINEK